MVGVLQRRYPERVKARPLALAVALAAAAPLWTAPAARADDAPAPAVDPRAAEIKRRGEEAIVSGRPAEALAAYTEAYGMTKDPALLYNKGRAFQALGEHASALEELEAFDKAATPELKARVPGLAKLLAEARQRVSSLEILCDTPGATVRLRDRTLGTTPLALTRVNAGKAVLEITRDGYFPYKNEILLPGGGLASLEIKLTSKATAGVLVVHSPVVGAAVSVDGAPHGNVPSELVVTPGSHQVSLSREGYKTATSSFVVAAGERKEIEVPLASEGSVLGKWWFWTGIGVVVAGGVGTYFLLTTERGPDSGTIAPGRITAGLLRF